MAKPSIPKGTRDFSPVEVSKRNHIISVMRHHFEKFGYQPIETPSFENSDTLMGKYGEEGDRLIFKILESGEYFEKAKDKIFILDNKSIIYISNILDHILNIFRDDFKNFALQYDISTWRSLREYFTSRLNISHIFQSKIESEDLKENLKQIETVFEEYFNKNAEKIVSMIFDRQYFFENDEIFNQFLIKEKVQIQDELIDLLKYKSLIDIKSNKLTSFISEKALRYDLTVPFARYVVQHQSEIEFPFKRYQIQPVWRADRPQKGRFREFYQCDADVVGSKSLWQEVELVQLYDAIFAALGLNGVTIKINNRKILTGIAEVIGASDKLIDFTVALDKLDKIGEEGVKKEMLEKGIPESALEKVQPLFHFSGSIEQKLAQLSILLSASEEGKKGIEELQFICENIAALGLQKAILDLDVTLARGLNYYTGAIFEVAAPQGVSMGSIGGGGRYDDLTGIFGLPNVSGVGISFGLDRIYLVLEELGLFPETVISGTKVLFLNFGKQELEAMQAIQKLRAHDIKCELYPDAAKIDKQFKHAERRHIPFVVKEITAGTFTVKNIVSGEQSQMGFEALAALLK